MNYAVLLRGINVGGINIKMADLREALISAGFRDVRTVLATGNVLLESGLTGPETKARIEKTLAARFGYEAWVIVLTPPALRSVVQRYPFDPERDGWHPYVIFGSDARHLAELLDAADALDPAVERVERGEGVVYWEVVKGRTTDSPFGKSTAKNRYKPTITTRNLRTLGKMLS
ncbi:DUF1697 domain-containing protein [Rhodococcus sp. BGS-1C]|jgi:uncharacterized protein (DUF1697 family)|uniref:DUF1697 domain-containing protein n=1 Tax=unclassified Rhodococcus (in: high G+C Gram-positive bacteria) TaxID=192944 RepID=UPI000968E67D|nr:DUF1697 domain-containing protein [Rhodococcus sp. KRD197]OLT32115.1 pyridoxamine 5-phosphate oxidase [Rhodococcus sp. CUA-806]